MGLRERIEKICPKAWNELEKIVQPPLNAVLFNKEKSVETLAYTLLHHNLGVDINDIIKGLLGDRERFNSLFKDLISSNKIWDLENYLMEAIQRRGYEKDRLTFQTYFVAVTHTHAFTPQRLYLGTGCLLSHNKFGGLLKYRIAPFVGEFGAIEIEAGVVSEDRKKPKIKKEEIASGLHSRRRYHDLVAHYITKHTIEIIEPILRRNKVAFWNFSPSNLYSYVQTQLFGAKIDLKRIKAKEELEYLFRLGEALQKNGFDIKFDSEGKIYYPNLKVLGQASTKLYNGAISYKGEVITFKHLTSHVKPTI